jgi:hypothetical protein
LSATSKAAPSQQVDQDLLQLVAVGPEERPRRVEVQLHLDPLRLQDVREQLHRLLDRRVHLHEVPLRGLVAGQGQEVLHDARAALRRLRDVPDPGGVGGGLQLAAEHRGLAHHHRQGVVQLVGHPREELAQGGQPLRLAQHLPLALHLLGDPPMVGDVLHEAVEEQAPRRGIADHAGLVAPPDHLLVPAPHPVLRDERVAVGHGALDQREHPVAVLAVEPLPPQLGIGRPFPGVEARHLVDLRAHEDRPPAGIRAGHVDEHGHLLDERAVLLLGRPALLLGLSPGPPALGLAELPGHRRPQPPQAGPGHEVARPRAHDRDRPLLGDDPGDHDEGHVEAAVAAPCQGRGHGEARQRVVADDDVERVAVEGGQHGAVCLHPLQGHVVPGLLQLLDDDRPVVLVVVDEQDAQGDRGLVRRAVGRMQETGRGTGRRVQAEGLRLPVLAVRRA